MGPASSCVLLMGSMPLRLTSPRVGRRPTRLVAEAGERIDWPVSLPVPTLPKLAAIAAAGMAVRIMRGESPARIPIQSFQKTKLMLNPAAIRAAGLTIPESVRKLNPEMIGN